MVREAPPGPRPCPHPRAGPARPLLTRVALQLQPALIHLPTGRPLSAMSRPSRPTAAPAGSPRRPRRPPGPLAPHTDNGPLCVTRLRRRYTSQQSDGLRPPLGSSPAGLTPPASAQVRSEVGGVARWRAGRAVSTPSARGKGKKCWGGAGARSLALGR